MGQIIGGAAKPKRCNINRLSQLGTPAAGEHILVSSDNSMNAAGQGNFDAYVVGDGHTAATELPLIKTYANVTDDEPTAGSDKLVKSGGVAAEFQKVFKETEIKLFQDIEGGKTFDTSGYRDYVKNATCKLVLNGTYSIPAMLSGYRYNIYKYVSDNEGVAVKTGWGNTAYTLELSGTYVFVFRHVIGSTVYNWNNDDTTVVNNIVVSVSDSSTIEGRLDALGADYDNLSDKVDNINDVVVGDSDSISVNIASGGRLSKYYTNITPGKSYGFRFATDNLVDLPYIKIFAEIDGDLTEISQINADEFGYIKIPAGTSRILFFNTTYVTSATSVIIDIISESITLDVERLKKEVFPYENNVVFCDDISSEVLVEMYFPNITNDWKIVGVFVYNTLFRLNLKDAQGNTHQYGEGSNTNSLEGKYSDLIHTWVDVSTCEVIGYFIFHYTGTDYSASDSNGFDINIDKVTNINYSPRIKEYLARTENLVLIGDSMFGKGEYNILSALLRSATDKKVFNGGMGGMRMSTRGNTYDDALSYVGISDAIYNEDWTDVQAAAIATGGATNPYQKRLAELKTVDWSLPTTVICCYCNNDITGNVVIGDMWAYTAQKSDFVKTTLLGAMNYGIYNILSKYPLIRLIHTTLAWRYKNDKNNNLVPPYAYLNANDDSDSDYNEAIKENALRLGISLFDFSAFGGRNEFNRNTENGILFDRSHFNIKGYERLTKMLTAIDKGWLM